MVSEKLIDSLDLVNQADALAALLEDITASCANGSGLDLSGDGAVGLYYLAEALRTKLDLAADLLETQIGEERKSRRIA